MGFCGVLWRGAVLSVVAALMVGAGGVKAAGAATGCPSYELSQPFVQWLDPLKYALVPNGGFESGPTGWTLSGGAKVVSGNERFAVRGAGDGYSLSLPTGSSATSAPMCVRTLDAVMRFFALNSGSLLSSLQVEVLYVDASGATRALPIGLVLAGGAWAPTLPAPVLVNLLALPLLSDGSIQVAFRFTPKGLLGGWRIDDVYLDPLKGT
jgi:hypothetical protein